MKKIFLSLILILIGVSTLSGCTKDEILNHYNNVCLLYTSDAADE